MGLRFSALARASVESSGAGSGLELAEPGVDLAGSGNRISGSTSNTAVSRSLARVMNRMLTIAHENALNLGNG